MSKYIEFSRRTSLSQQKHPIPIDLEPVPIDKSISLAKRTPQSPIAKDIIRSTKMASPPTSTPDQTIYKLTFTTPPSHTTAILAALHATSAGTWPNPPSASGSTDTTPTPPKYTHTAFVSQGTGQFRPSAHASPHIGTPGAVEMVDEDRVEMVVVGREVLRQAVKALREAHPYEVVAFYVVKCLGEDEF